VTYAEPWPTRKGTRPALRAGWRTWLVSLMVTVLAVAPLLGILHRASVPHAICEHGDWIEPDQGSTQRESGASRADADAVEPGELRSSSLSRLRRDTAPVVHTHDHCSVATLAKAGAGVGASSSVIVALLQAGVSGVPSSESPPARPLLSNAPKTSPPRTPVRAVA